MGFLLLGVDSLIACVAIGPVVGRRVAVPLALLFGVCDGAGFLIGTAFHWSMSDSVSNVVQTAILAAMGVYWIAIALLSRSAAKADQQAPASRWGRWGVWVLPFALSVDNITFGIVDGVSKNASVWASAGEQALSSAVQAGIGLAIGMAIAYSIPAVRRHMALANGIAGGALIVAAGALLMVG